MPFRTILIVIAVVIVLTMLFGNKKVRVFQVLKNQIKVFKNAKKNKTSIWDIICFVIFPIVLAVILVIGLDYEINETLAGVLTTVFAFVFTVLFGFAAILVGKIDSKNEIEKQVVGETFISIMTSNILSLVSAIFSIMILNSESDITRMIFSTIIYSCSFMIIMLLLMITKRTFIIYCTYKK